jgi:hypothetical protein
MDLVSYKTLKLLDFEGALLFVFKLWLHLYKNAILNTES